MIVLYTDQSQAVRRALWESEQLCSIHNNPNTVQNFLRNQECKGYNKPNQYKKRLLWKYKAVY